MSGFVAYLAVCAPGLVLVIITEVRYRRRWGWRKP